MQADCPRDSEFVCMFSHFSLFFFFDLEIQNNSPTISEKVIETYLSWRKYLKSIGNKEVSKPLCLPTGSRMLQQIRGESLYVSNPGILGFALIQSFFTPKGGRLR